MPSMRLPGRPASRRITVRTVLLDDNKVELSVSDTGQESGQTL